MLFVAVLYRVLCVIIALEISRIAKMYFGLLELKAFATMLPKPQSNIKYS